MARPLLPGLTGAEQELLYRQLGAYNEGRASYKEVGTYLVVLPRPGHPLYSLWVYSPLPERQSIFYLCDLSADARRAVQMAGAMCLCSRRRVLLVEYNAKRMQSRGDDIVGFGKYRGHFLHEVLRRDPAYVSWIAFKYQPRIPKQERFVQIARIYYAAYQDFQRRKQRRAGDFLGREGEQLRDLRLTVVSVRVEDNPWRTQVRGNTPLFYVRQVLRLRDEAGNVAVLRVNARTASRASCQVPAIEHSYSPGETLRVASARVAATYVTGGVRCTRLTHVRLDTRQEDEG